MNLKFVPIILPVLIASLIALYVLFYTWQRRTMPGARPLLPLMLGIVIWLVGSTIEGLYADYETRLFWINIQYVGIVMVPTTWFVFSLLFTHRWAALSRTNLALLLIMPIVTLILVWTNARHQLFRLSLALDTSGAYPVWEWEPGAGFWLHTLYSYILLFSGFIVLVQAYRHSSRLYQRQISVILLGAAVPWLANILFVVIRVGPIDYTPIAFLISGSAVAWGIFKVGLVEIRPIIHKRVIDEMQDGVLVLDEKNRVLEANTAVLQMINVTQEIIGQPIAQVLMRWPGLVAQYQGRSFSQEEISLPLPGQATRHYQVTSTPLHDKKGQQTGHLIMVHEITRLKQTEASLKKAKDAAEAANRAKSTFLATMSHELRTPLAAIIGYSELIEEKSEVLGYEKIVPHLRKIGSAAYSLNFIIGNILDLSKIEADRMDLFYEIFSVAALVSEVTHNVLPQIEKNRNKLALNLPDDLGMLYSDQAKLRQILINLLGNAAKFTREGEIVLSVRRDEAFGYLEFAVADNGEGIPEGIMAKLFQPFFQADASFTRVHGGSGLGLAISHRFCQMLGGSITVESQLGKGTTFLVKIPIERSINEQTEPETAVLNQ